MSSHEGICRTATHRGVKGSKHQTKITTLTSHHQSYIQDSSNTVCLDNLTVVPLSKPVPGVRAALANCRSVRNKTSAIVDHLDEFCLDMLALTETWLNESDLAIINQLTPPGYTFHHKPRADGRKGGGVALICRDSFKVKEIETVTYQSYEYIHLHILVGSSMLNVVVLYRIPPSQTNRLTKNDFMSEFPQHLESLSFQSGKLIVLGDFNIHWDDELDSETVKLKDLLSSLGLSQHISEATHEAGHTIDLIISNDSQGAVNNAKISELISDHHAIHFDITCNKPHPVRKNKDYRKIKNINLNDFREDVSEMLTTTATKSLDEQLEQYNDVLEHAIDKHAPLLTKAFVERKPQPWINAEIMEAKIKRRKSERIWRKSRLPDDRIHYKQNRDTVNKLIEESKKSYFNEKIESCGDDQGALFRLLNGFFSENSSNSLPDCYQDDKTVAAEFSDYLK